jgi:hypothetical protein
MAIGEGLHKHAFWLYGVIVGLAIKEALASTVPDILNPTEPKWEALLDFSRLVVFVFFTTRFFLGSAYFFEEVYTGPNAVFYDKKNYFLDFLFGLAHFLLFFAWSLTIDFHQKDLEYFFRYILAGLLFYDVLWLIMSRKYDTKRQITPWTALNVVTLILASGLFWVTRKLIGQNMIAESVAFVPVFIVSVIDMAELTSGRRLVAEFVIRIADWIAHTASRFATWLKGLVSTTSPS